MSEPSPVHRSIWWGALAGALLTLAGHLDLIRVFGTVLPYRDQWQLTGVELLGPWVDGELTLGSFFQPLNDHWPVLTRVLSFTLVRLNGQWNNLVHTTFNAFILAGAVMVFLRATLPGLRGWVRPVLALLTGAVMALPIAWQNTLWGIQSLPYLQILLSLGYLHLLTTADGFSQRWWIAQVLGILVLFTQHSSILAHVAIALVFIWRIWRGDGSYRYLVVSLGLALATIGAFFTLFPEIQATAHYQADSIALAVEVTLRQLAFPTDHPGWAFLLWAPWLLLAIDSVARRRLSSSTLFVLAIGLWVGGQAAAIGYGRGAETYTFASRYCDFLALGFCTNAAAGLLLAHRWARVSSRVGLGTLAAVWLIAPIEGFLWESMESHAGFNLSNRIRENPANLKRVQDYLATRDPAVLSLERGGALLFTYPPAVQSLLDRPGFRALLPPETLAPEARPDHGRLGGLAGWIHQNSLLWALLGFGALGAGMLTGRREPASAIPADGSESDWTFPRLVGLVGAAGLICGTVWHQWYLPREFDPVKRARAIIEPAEAGVAFAELDFERESVGTVDPSRTPGATLAEPEIWRPFTHGTAIDGPAGFQGTLASKPIRVTDDYLSLLFTGFPCAHGNGMRWKLLPPDGGEPVWSGYDGVNPEAGWHTWTVDMRDYRGWQASLYLFDGRADREGWLGCTRPVFTADPDWAAGWRARLRAERAGSSQRVMRNATYLLSAATLIGMVLIPLRSRHRKKI